MKIMVKIKAQMFGKKKVDQASDWIRVEFRVFEYNMPFRIEIFYTFINLLANDFQLNFHLGLELDSVILF